jgi:hypothetical protein
MRIVGILVIAGTVAGCSVGEKIAARGEYEQSANNYKQCLAANANSPKQCEGLRLAMEAAERKRDSIDTDLQFRPGTPPPDYAAPR